MIINSQNKIIKAILLKLQEFMEIIILTFKYYISIKNCIIELNCIIEMELTINSFN